jgi:Fe-S cluster assembly protein SufD
VLQRDGDATWHLGNVAARLARDARFAARTLTLGGAGVRNDLLAVLADTGAECDLDGLFLGAGSRIVDNHTTVDHAAPHGTSRELYKGILGDRSRGVFRGRIVVRPDAQKTDARQSNANVLIGSGAEIDTKPQLEIWADDVRCSHGATIGRLDETALFYLRSRGIGEAAARDLLLRGFAAEVLRKIGSESLAEALGDLLVARLQGSAAR